MKTSPFRGKVKTSSGPGSEIPSADNHPAVLVAIVDLGTHMESFQGADPKPTRKVLFVWELVTEKLSGTTNNHVIGRVFTLSFHKKSGLMAMLTSWKGEELPEGFEVDLEVLLGKKCMLSVVHVKSKDGEKTYANVGTISKVPKGLTVPERQHEPILWTLANDEEPPAVDWLPWVYDKSLQMMNTPSGMIAHCLELTGGIPEADAAGDASEGVPVPDMINPDSDSIPF